MRRTHIHALNILILLALVGNALAGDREWRTGGGGSFYTNTNWNPIFVPGIADVAIFDMLVTSPVIMGFATTNNDRLVVRNAQLTIDLNGNPYVLNALGTPPLDRGGRIRNGHRGC